VSEDYVSVGNCEWCRDEVWSDYAHFYSSGYVWHRECAASNQLFLEDAILVVVEYEENNE
jgi:hypothetical protein